MSNNKHKGKTSKETSYASKVTPLATKQPNVVAAETPTKERDDSILKMLSELQTGMNQAEQSNIVYHRKVDDLLQKQKTVDNDLDDKIAEAISAKIGAKTDTAEEERSNDDGYETNDTNDLNDEDRESVRNMRKQLDEILLTPRKKSKSSSINKTKKTSPPPPNKSSDEDKHYIDPTGNHSRHSNFLKFAMNTWTKSCEKFELQREDFDAVRIFYFGIRTRLICATNFPEILPPFEHLTKLNCDLKAYTQITFCNQHLSAKNNEQQLQLLLQSLLYFPQSPGKIQDSCTNINKICMIHASEHCGLSLLSKILQEIYPHLGGKFIDIIEEISTLQIDQGDTLASFLERT